MDSRPMRLPVSPSASRLRLAAQETLPAVHRPPLCRLEWHGGFAAALRANSHGFRLAGARYARLPLALASFAALGLVLEVLVMEEVLFSRCENKFRSAFRALENPILELRHNPTWFPRTGCGTDRQKPVRPCYSISRRDFFRFRLRASACLTRFFSPGFK